MEKDTAAVIVKVYAVLGWIGAAFGILFGILMMAGGAFVGALLPAEELGPMGSLVGAFAIAMGLFIIGLSIVSIFISLGLWKLKNWARIVTIVFAWIGGVFGVMSLLMMLFTFDIFGVIFELIILAIYAFTIWFFQFVPATKELFTGAPAVAAKPAPAPKKK